MEIQFSRADVPLADRAELEALIADFGLLEDVVRSKVEIVDVVVQDEFTHDVVTRFGAWYLVFDAT